MAASARFSAWMGNIGRKGVSAVPRGHRVCTCTLRNGVRATQSTAVDVATLPTGFVVRPFSILSRYNRPPLNIPGAADPEEGDVDAKEAQEATEAVYGELGTERRQATADGKVDNWHDSDVLEAAMRELEAGRRVQEDTLAALGESREYKAFDEEVSLAVEAVRAGYEAGDEPLTTQRISQMQAHVQQTINETMERHAEKVALDAIGEMTPEEMDRLREMFARLEKDNVKLEPEGFVDREDLMADFGKAARIMEEVGGDWDANDVDDKHVRRPK